MDFGIGFLSNNVMLPILDFFYGIFPSYGFAIIALTLVVRFGVYPLSAGQIRNMRKMRITQPLMKERQDEIKARYKDNPAKQQEELGKLMQEFGNPLAGCLPLLLQMPILFALFATLRGSPFANIKYSVEVQVLPQEKIEQVQFSQYNTKPQNLYVEDGIHYSVQALIPTGNKLGVGESTHVDFQTPSGKTLASLRTENPQYDLTPVWSVTKGEDRISVDKDGNITALATGSATVQAEIPGLAADKGFLFIKALGQVGVVNEDKSINWDILGMVLFFGFSLYINQQLSGSSSGSSGPDQQQTVNKITPIIFSGMFLFFPLPAGVLMYIVLANVFQTVQTFFLMKEPLPENLQKLVEQKEKQEKGRQSLPFEKGKRKNKPKTSG